MNTLGKAGLMAATFFLSLSSQAQNRKVPPGAQSSLVSISPISMTANAGGLEVTKATLEKWAAQTELTTDQLESFGVGAGKWDETLLRKVVGSALERRARTFSEFVDRGVFRLDRNSTMQASAEFAPSWGFLATSEEFIADAIYFGKFDRDKELRLRAALRSASQEKGINDLGSSTVAFTLLSDSRIGAIKVSRGYRQLTEILRRELNVQEAVKNIGIVMEVRTKGREQATISPVSRVTLNCATGSKSTLVFSQRRRDCNELGVCRVESLAELTGNSSYESVYNRLSGEGRTFLDQCNLETTMLIDGEEVTRVSPGKFTSHVPLPQ